MYVFVYFMPVWAAQYTQNSMQTNSGWSRSVHKHARAPVNAHIISDEIFINYLKAGVCIWAVQACVCV